MREIGAFEAKNTLGSLLDLVQRGEEIVITRHGKRVARLIPEGASQDISAAKDALERIRLRRAKRKGSLPSVEEWVEFRNEGRR